jgi:hypothetical protein
LLWSISTAAGAIAFVLYKVGFSYAWFGAALLMLGLLLFAIVLARVRVYEEEEIGRSAAPLRQSGFRLASDFRYKRQALWVLVDAATVVLSVYGTYLFLFGGQPDWPIRIDHFTHVAPVAVALVLAGLLAQGVYRTDWQHFSLREGFTIAVGSTIGLSAAFALSGRLGDGVAVFAMALIATMLAIGGTRLFARALDLALRAGQKIDQDPHLRTGHYANEKI